MKSTVFILLSLIYVVACLIPPKFQWKTIDFAWDCKDKRVAAILANDYIPMHNMPAGLARWNDKLFITIPRWKKGVPSSLNYVRINNGTQNQLLHPYPSWKDAFVRDSQPMLNSNATVVSTFRIHVDDCDRLWVVDNGVSDMASGARQVTEPALIIFDLTNDSVMHRFTLPANVVRSSSVFTSVVVDTLNRNCNDNAFAYITDMGSNALVVFSLTSRKAWRIEHPYFNFDPSAGVYRVGGVDFYWNDGVSTATLSKAGRDGHKDLFLQPTSSTKQFKISTRLLRNSAAKSNEIANGVEIVGDRGPKTQSTACDYDPQTNVLFYTLVSKNGFGCWNLDKPYKEEFTPLVMSDCNLLEFPNDIKVDKNGNLWILSNRQSKFLYEMMDFNQINFRILTAPAEMIIQGTSCEGKIKNVDSFVKLIMKGEISG